MAETLLPETFRKSSENIVSYSWESFADRTGYIILYGGMLGETTEQGTTSTNKYILSQNQFFSSDIILEDATGVVSGETFAKYETVEKDFDLSPFKITTTLYGKGLIKNGFTIKSNYSSRNIRVKLKYILKKVSSGVESEICSNFSEMLQTTSLNYGTVTQLVSLQLDVTKTLFKVGDFLRLTVEVWASEDTNLNNVGGIRIGTDPQNRDDTYLVPSTNNTHTTQLILYCPFEIQE